MISQYFYWVRLLCVALVLGGAFLLISAELVDYQARAEEQSPEDEEEKFDPAKMEKPVKLKAPAPRFPKIAEALGIECNIVIETTIDEQGHLQNPQVREWDTLCLMHDEFAQSALEAVEKWTFKPAKKDGIPVAVKYTLTVGFRLRSGKARDDNPQVLAQAYINRGVAYYKREQFDKACDDYTSALTYWPSEQAYGNRAFIHLTQKRYAEALSDYSEALKLSPNNGRLYFYRGLAYAGQDDCESARTDYGKACQLDYARACSATCP